MIAMRSDTPTGQCCLVCEHAVVRPWGARRDEYLVCDACDVERRTSVPEPVIGEVFDLSDSFWRIATGEHTVSAQAQVQRGPWAAPSGLPVERSSSAATSG